LLQIGVYKTFQLGQLGQSRGIAFQSSN